MTPIALILLILVLAVLLSVLHAIGDFIGSGAGIVVIFLLWYFGLLGYALELFIWLVTAIAALFGMIPHA